MFAAITSVNPFRLISQKASNPSTRALHCAWDPPHVLAYLRPISREAIFMLRKAPMLPRGRHMRWEPATILRAEREKAR